MCRPSPEDSDKNTPTFSYPHPHPHQQPYNSLNTLSDTDDTFTKYDTLSIPSTSTSPATLSPPLSPSCSSALLPNLSTHQDPKLDSSLLVIYMLTITAEAARGLLLPTLWPFLKSLDGSKSLLGFLVSIYSLGRMLSVIPLGYLSDKFSTSFILITASILQAFGHLMYATSSNITFLFLSRAIVGFGSATTSIARAHVTKTVCVEKRTCHLAYLSGLQFIGFAVLPVFGGLMNSLPSYTISSWFKFNVTTYPAYVLVLANLICVYLIFFFYKDPKFSNISNSSRSSSSCCNFSISTASSATITADTREPDYCAIFICLFINLVFRGVLAQLETVSIPFLTEQFHVSPSQASYYMFLIGILGTLLYFSFKPLSSQFSDRLLTLIGLIFISLGSLPLSFHSLSSNMSLAVYLILLAFIWSIAYPVGQTALLSLFSKTLRGVSIGSFMGIFSASGAISPLVLSVAAGWMWEQWGRESVFTFIVGISIMALIVMWAVYHRLDVEKDF